ncbi:MAG: penicillin-binding protein 1C, partial [Treponema sp.]|nr:penicillin-binding protein 1C [Treponema sp.]
MQKIAKWVKVANHKQITKKRILAFCLLLASAISLVILFVRISYIGGPYSYVLYDKDGKLLGASVASDGQWRFAPISVPKKFEKAIITFEDKRFFFHCGIDPIAIFRSAFLNIRSGKIVSGASTITMQTVRILQHNPPRTFPQKIKEALLAYIYEMRYTKKSILKLYAANAPFGGNVVGIEAASWRYFNRPPDSLSWAETATLAVLPNAPSLVHPGSRRNVLLAKRDNLLYALHKKGYIDSTTLELSLAETLPEKPYDLPNLAPHYLEKMKRQKNASTQIFSTLDENLQIISSSILEKWSSQFARSGINNAACIILNTKTCEVLAYCGNTNEKNRNATTHAVDIVSARRSSGSLLKPFLFAAMIDSGMLLPNQLVIDVPTRIGSYKPENNIPVYRGAVPASEALSRSLNIPAVRELREYGIASFLDYLKNCGFTTFTRRADDYGLPLILGGGEVKLEEVARAYAFLMQAACGNKNSSFPISSAAAFLTLSALEDGIRPDDEAAWQSFSHAKRIAWKTGTSNGNRDAWAVGTTADYTVGVWVGNAEGQGRPDLKSSSTALPVMFDIFSTLPQSRWPDIPYDELENIDVCVHSGYKASMFCKHTKKLVKPTNAPTSELCPYCIAVSFTPDKKYRATSQDMKGEYSGLFPIVENRFVLPPTVEYWYARSTLGYSILPPYLPEKNSSDSLSEDFSIMFPEQGANIIIPTEIDGKQGNTLMQV